MGVWRTCIGSMLFNSFEFMLFLPVVFLLYWFVFRPRKMQNLFLVIASYVFYGWWDWRFLFLIALTSFCSYASGLLLERFGGNRRIQKTVSASNIILNLLILCVFKYYNFFMDNIEALFRSIGYQMDWVTLDIILPVGISFYTFQALSYTIDIYQKKIQATSDPIEFFAYISFFPQLVAGPIERATNLLPQFQKDRHFDYAKAVDGSRQMLWGFFKKLVIADNCGDTVNMLWNSYADLAGVNLLALGILFTFQIYCDFSGYSDIAIGCARIFGINLMQNFNSPYLSRSIPEFWRRWHVSLMSWFRDYVYFPLGGSRCETWKIYRNILIVFSVSGLWHGANWTFVAWGVYNALLIILWRVLGVKTDSKKIIAHSKRLPSAKEIIQVLMTFFMIIIGWILFRAENLTQASDYLIHMFSTMGQGLHLEIAKRMLLFGIIPLMIVEYLQRDKTHVLQFPQTGFFRYKAVRWTLYIVLIFSAFLFNFTGESQEFIYFQF